MSKTIMHILFALSLILLLGSCERRPIIEMNSAHYVRIYIDEQLKNVTIGHYNNEYLRPAYKQPNVMRVVLADPITGIAKSEKFLRNKGQDEYGTYYDGYIVADPGTYTMMGYIFDTETTIVDESNNFTLSTAYTNEIASHLRSKISSRANVTDEKIVYEPDQIFVTPCEEVTIHYNNGVDTLRTESGERIVAKSLVKSYYMQIQVKGIQYASSTVGLLTGLSGSCHLVKKEIDTTDSVTVYFEMNPYAKETTGYQEYHNPGARNNDEGVVTLYTTFNTFGKIPDLQNRLNITFDFITTYGKTFNETIDITDLFTTTEAIDNQWLLIDHTIVIPEPPPTTGGGGFNPDVDEWEEENKDINI